MLLCSLLIVRCHLSYYQYAAYGSNLHPVRLQKRVPSALLLGTSVLPEYELRFNKIGRNDGSGKCNVVPGGTGVHLAIFKISESERSMLDKCEGLGKGYDHFEIDTEGFGLCSSYIAAPSVTDESLQPIDWYKEMVLLGVNFNQFPTEYCRNVELVSAVEDPDDARSIREWKHVEELRRSALAERSGF